MNKNLLFFDSMITPKIITFIYWLLLLADVSYGINTMFSGYDGFTITKFIVGLGYAIIGAIGIRIWCELMIVVFKINENLQNLKNK
ncbi:MAG: DUF4282 domain-containing protein [Bacteroidetes bacterium]|nr:DUF4282 domain-containing protein [Bacteroidota bacterium]